MTEDVITQVQAPPGPDSGDFGLVADLPETVVLAMRGSRFEIKREKLLALPESILFGLSSGMAAAPFGHGDEPESDAMELDFNPDCFRYILRTLDAAGEGLSPLPVSAFKAQRSPGYQQEHDDATSAPIGAETADDEDSNSVESLPWLPLSSNEIPEVLKSRPSLLVLREDLDYYVLDDPKNHHDTRHLDILKGEIGDLLTSRDDNRLIFKGLQNTADKLSPEFHLMQMLEYVGLSQDQKWAFRDRASRSSQILSLQISKIALPKSNTMLDEVYALQKMLLFWRKPAKKCWWDKVAAQGCVVHVRRVWTLELTILGLSSS